MLRPDCPVAFAGRSSQPFRVGDLEVTAAVTKNPGLLQRMGDDRHRVALHTDHLRQDLLRQWQALAAGSIAGMQQPTREARFDRMRRIARGGLLGLCGQGLLVPRQQSSESGAPVGGRAKARNIQNRSCTRQPNHRVGQGCPIGEPGRGAENAVRADHRHLHRLSFLQAVAQGNDAALGQIDMRQRRAGFYKDSFPYQLADLEMRTQQLEVRREQSLQQLVG